MKVRGGEKLPGLISCLVCLFNVSDCWLQDCHKVVPLRDGVVCLRLFSQRLTQSAAARFCAHRKSQLLSVTSYLVQQQVLELLKDQSAVSSVWLGLTEKAFPWKWIESYIEVQSQGCFLDDVDSRDLEVKQDFPDLTTALCLDYCSSRRFLYAGVQAGVQCWCGQSFGKHGQDGEWPCNKPCRNGEGTEVCGGTLASNIMAVKGSFSNWQNGQPNNYQGYQKCAVMDKDFNFEWNDVSCSDPYGVVCEIPLSVDHCIGSSFLFLNGKCTLAEATKLTFFQALQRCDNMRGSVIRVGDNRTQSVLASFLRSRFGNSSSFWLGLVSAEWRWPTGEPVRFSEWRSGKPNGAVGLQSCAGLFSDGTWDDVDCDNTYAFVCQQDNVTRSRAPTMRPTEAPQRDVFPATDGAPSSFWSFVTELDQGVLAAVGSGVFFVIFIIVITTCKVKQRKRSRRKEKKFDYFLGVDLPVSATDVDKPRERTPLPHRLSLQAGSELPESCEVYEKVGNVDLIADLQTSGRGKPAAANVYAVSNQMMF